MVTIDKDLPTKEELFANSLKFHKGILDNPNNEVLKDLQDEMDGLGNPSFLKPYPKIWKPSAIEYTFSPVYTMSDNSTKRTLAHTFSHFVVNAGHTHFEEVKAAVPELIIFCKSLFHDPMCEKLMPGKFTTVAHPEINKQGLSEYISHIAKQWVTDYYNKTDDFNKSGVSLEDLDKYIIKLNPEKSLRSLENIEVTNIIARSFYAKYDVEQTFQKGSWQLSETEMEKVPKRILTPEHYSYKITTLLDKQEEEYSLKPERTKDIPNNEITLLKKVCSALSELDKGNSIKL